MVKIYLLVLSLILEFCTAGLDVVQLDTPQQFPKQCGDAENIFKIITSDSQNTQQIQHALFPVNDGEPSLVLLAYFTNYSGALPQQCSQGTYPWDTYPQLNYSQVYWFEWTINPALRIVSYPYLLEYGLYLPTVSYLELFHQLSPLMPLTRIACVSIPCYLDFNDTADYDYYIYQLQQLTLMLKANFSSGFSNNDEHDGFVTHYELPFLIEDVRILQRLPKGSNQFKFAFYGFILTIYGGATLLLYTIEMEYLYQILKRIESSNFLFAITWSCNTLLPLMLLYLCKMTIALVYINKLLSSEEHIIYKTLFIPPITGLPLSGFIAFKALRKAKFDLPVPRIYSFLLELTFGKCRKNNSHVILWISLCLGNAVALSVSMNIPFTVLLISGNSLLYGSALISIVLLALAMVCLLATAFALDQMCIRHNSLIIRPSHAFQLAGILLLCMFAMLSLAGFTASIHFLLIMSRKTNMVRSVSQSVSAIIHIIIVPLITGVFPLIKKKLNSILKHLLN